MRGRIFLLSPANCGGARGRLLVADRSRMPLARRLRDEGAPIGEVFSFVSGLYFRGKLAYARRFAASPDPGSAALGGGVLVITPNAGLWTAESAVTRDTLQTFAGVEVSPDNDAYCRPLAASATALLGEARDSDIVLLGSIATDRYIAVLSAVLGVDRLLVPADFIGRGDMSRGSLLLDCAASGRELEYLAASRVPRGERGRSRQTPARPSPAARAR